MKNIYITLTLIFLSFFQFSSAQETLSLGAGYANESFYSLANGEVKSEPYDNWDLSFQISGFAAAIRVNTAKGLTLKKVPNADAAAWATLDTAGYDSWSFLYDSDESWDRGAFNLGIEPGNDFDLGWGVYNPVTHHVNGDSLYLLAFADGSVKKLKINSLISGVYSFTHANLDGSSEITSSLTKSEFSGKFFGYYSFAGDSTLDREPAATDYDLRFTKYFGLLAPGTYYPVTGVLSNAGVEVAELRQVDVNAVGIADTAGLTFSSSISTIGYDWKAFSMSTFTWVLDDSLTYFVKALDGEIYKLTFTGFGGTATGNIEFTKTNLTTAVDPQKDIFMSLNIFPNPAKDKFTLLFELKNNDLLNISLTDLSGKILLETQPQSYYGLQQLEFNTPQLAAGLYLLRLESNGNSTTRKLIIR
ncbi:MAG: T9SS type A sorting domain-containing protein [Bacteroidia bacterium]|nr:T9SS type A sorting domain-containing protein [Bacteroidia bacterium]